MATLIDTVAWIHLRQGYVLGTRSRGKSLFYIPGGKRHPGESDLATLSREVSEELTVSVTRETVRHFGTYEAAADAPGSNPRVRMACYTGDFSGTLTASAEIEELAWLGYTDRDRTPPVDRLVFDDLKALGLLN